MGRRWLETSLYFLPYMERNVSLYLNLWRRSDELAFSKWVDNNCATLRYAIKLLRWHTCIQVLQFKFGYLLSPILAVTIPPFKCDRPEPLNGPEALATLDRTITTPIQYTITIYMHGLSLLCLCYILFTVFTVSSCEHASCLLRWLDQALHCFPVFCLVRTFIVLSPVVSDVIALCVCTNLHIFFKDTAK
jgi:hypothetical protein